MSQREIDRTLVNAGVKNFPAEAAVLFEWMWVSTGKGGSYGDAWDCAQTIIPTDLKQLARMKMMQFGVFRCADRIFMLEARCYNMNTGAPLRDQERKLFSDNGLVAYFIRQYADQFGYEVQEKRNDGFRSLFRLKRVRVLPIEEVQLMTLEHLTEHLKHNAGFYPGTQEITELLIDYMSMRHEQAHFPPDGIDPDESPLFALP